MAKPSELPVWATDGAALVENPGTAKKEQGWAVEKPNVKFMNYILNLIYQWIVHFDTEVDAVAAQQLNYDAIVGVGGTHGTINDAVAAVSAGAKILVKDPFALTVTQVIDKDDILVEFAPTAVISTVTSLALGLQVDAERVRVIGGRFIGFNTGTDKAIQLTANCKNCLVTQAYFLNNDTDIDDLGTNSVLTANVNEVA